MALCWGIILYPTIGILISFIIFLKLYYNYCFSYWKKRGIYSPTPSIPFGNASGLYTGKECLGELFMNIYLNIKSKGVKHGGFYFWGRNVYMPVDNEIIKKMVIRDFENFPNHGLYINEELEPMSGHIFNMEDGKWRNLRAKLPSAFTTSKMKKMFGEMVKLQSNLTEHLDIYETQSKPVNIKEVLVLFSTDIILKNAFGLETNCLQNKDLEFIKHGRTFFDDQWSTFNNTLVITTPRKYLKWMNFKVFKKEGTDFFTKVFKDIKDFREKNGSSRNDLTDLLIRLTKSNPEDDIFKDFNGKGRIENLTFNEFAAQAYVFFEAGFETSSTTMTFALYALATNPKCQEALRDEINGVMKKYDGKCTYEAMLEMDYLDHVVDETLRLYPAFPIMPRICNKPYQVPGTDLVLEDGTLCMVAMMGVHRDPDLWPEPEIFDPNRFTKENKATRPSCAYMPFGDGPRVCIGKRFGLLQTKAGLISIIKNYNVTLSNRTINPLKFDTRGVILKTKGDVWLNLHRI
ncbi:unnamed protein product [Brassicogethes aeneus]|uniref:Cytochrome P450 n=1 Tax=Brassicogethes aeneus TaxID=1431903 RepID=A0A9P0BDT8_BRAAE|nr:unnamed protein product [Brassicogethes aeneus]